MAAAAALGSCVRALLLLLAGAISALSANYCVTVAGLGGTPDYEKEFWRLAKELEGELASNGPDTHVVTLTGPNATREKLREAVSRIAHQATAQDTFSLFLIGHGTFDGETYKFNLPGPDVTAQELADLMNSVPARRQLVVDMSSASGAAFPVLAAKGRVVITATKSGNEKNATVFARYWVEALRDPTADTDKNGTVSALEAYTYAQAKVKAFYDSEKLLATEHSQITPATEKTVLAGLYPVLQKFNPAEARTSGPIAARAQELEQQIEHLKESKTSMRPEAYRQQLTALLVALARTDAEMNP